MCVSEKKNCNRFLGRNLSDIMVECKPLCDTCFPKCVWTDVWLSHTHTNCGPVPSLSLGYCSSIQISRLCNLGGLECVCVYEVTRAGFAL